MPTALQISSGDTLESDPLGLQIGHQLDQVRRDAPAGRAARPLARRQIGEHRARALARGVAPCRH